MPGAQEFAASRRRDLDMAVQSGLRVSGLGAAARQVQKPEIVHREMQSLAD